MSLLLNCSFCVRYFAWHVGVVCIMEMDRLLWVVICGTLGNFTLLNFSVCVRYFACLAGVVYIAEMD